MKGSDKLLTAIVLAIATLVMIAIGITLLKDEANFLPEDTPSGITHNYLLALQQKDYERAYSYLADSCYLPRNYDQFERDIENNTWQFRLNQNPSLSIASSDIDGDSAQVLVYESNFTGGGLFESGENLYSFDVKLELQNGNWGIVDADRYFDNDWDCR